MRLVDSIAVSLFMTSIRWQGPNKYSDTETRRLVLRLALILGDFYGHNRTKVDTTTNSMQLFSHDLLNTKNLLAQRGATKTSSFPAKYFHAMFFWTPCAVWKPTCKSIQAASRLVRHCASPTITVHPSHCAVQNAKTQNIQKRYSNYYGHLTM